MMDLDYPWYFCNGSRSDLRFHTLLRKMNPLNDRMTPVTSADR
jgi:hypothetical protein